MASKRSVVSKSKYEYGEQKRRVAPARLGLLELGYILDYEMSIGAFVDNFERNQLIWIIARETRLRP